VCSQGKCATSCGGGTKLCGATCADTKNDPQNCGDCNTKCTTAQVCSAGSCGTTCGTGQTFCGGDSGAPYCASTKSDNANCGGCGITCDTGQVCSGGTCANACGGDDAGTDTLCTPDSGVPYCANTKTDNANCGACGVTCGSGQVCQNGACANGCASQDGGVQTLCTPDAGTPYCADVTSDNSNCGACGVTCAQGTTCTSGACKATSCPGFDGTVAVAGPYFKYGFCWYLTADGQTCDNACKAVGGSNLANSAASAWPDACSSATSADVSTWFDTHGNVGGWFTTSGGTAYHTLGYGYRGSYYYGKCAAGTATGNGVFPGDSNSSTTRSVICPCF
jgi:hypothetical protein